MGLGCERDATTGAQAVEICFLPGMDSFSGGGTDRLKCKACEGELRAPPPFVEHFLQKFPS